MNYAFLEKTDISDLENFYLHTKYSIYLSKKQIQVYEILVKQSQEINYLYSLQNIINTMDINSSDLKSIFYILMKYKLLEIYKNENYIFKLNKIKINSEFYNLEFVKETAFVDYTRFKSLNLKQKKEETWYFNYELISIFLKNNQIYLNSKCLEKLNNFNKIHQIKDAQLVIYIKKSYNNIKKEIDFEKFKFYANNDLNLNSVLNESLLIWIKKESNNLYAAKDLDIFVKLLNKHPSLQNEQIKAIISYVYKTQTKIHFNFIDVLAINCLRQKTNTYDQTLKFFQEFKSKNTFTNSKQKNLNNVTTEFNIKDLNRSKPSKTEKSMSLKQILEGD